MEGEVVVLARDGKNWETAVLTDEHGDIPMVLDCGFREPLGPADVEQIGVRSTTPWELIDAAVEAGYYVTRRSEQ